VTRRPAIDLAALPASLAARNPGVAAPTRPRRAPAATGQRGVRPAPPRALPGPQDAAAGVVVIDLPGLRLKSEANERGGTLGAKSRRAKGQRASVLRALAGAALPPLPVRVCVTRISPRRIDGDNLAGACKAPRDAAAEALGIDDGPAETRAVWRESQAVGPYGVRVTLVPIDGRAQVVVGERADVVRLAITRDQAGEIVRGLLDREGGRARVEVGGVVVEMTVTAMEVGR